MKIKYDPEADAAYISFKKGLMEATTIRLLEDIAIDLEPNEEVVGIEILDDSEHFGFKKGNPEIELENIKVPG